jgi:uncharacterized membrane protein YhaH (DUF805 family)
LGGSFNENLLITLLGVLGSPGMPSAGLEISKVLIICQLLPQIIINYRRHHTEGLQGSMMLLWATAGVPLGVYNIVEDFNIALKIQPQILTTLSLITWTQCLYYGKVCSHQFQGQFVNLSFDND